MVYYGVVGIATTETGTPLVTNVTGLSRPCSNRPDGRNLLFGFHRPFEGTPKG
jgi:hypothetical protein